MLNKLPVLILGVVLNILFFALFLFGLGSSILWLSNLAMFVMGVITVLAIISIFMVTNGSEEAKRINSYPTWYKFIITVTGVSVSLLIAAKGFFIIASIWLVADIMQGYHMWKSKP